LITKKSSGKWSQKRILALFQPTDSVIFIRIRDDCTARIAVVSGMMCPDVRTDENRQRNTAGRSKALLREDPAGRSGKHVHQDEHKREPREGTTDEAYAARPGRL